MSPRCKSVPAVLQIPVDCFFYKYGFLFNENINIPRTFISFGKLKTHMSFKESKKAQIYLPQARLKREDLLWLMGQSSVYGSLVLYCGENLYGARQCVLDESLIVDRWNTHTHTYTCHTPHTHMPHTTHTYTVGVAGLRQLPKTHSL